MGHRFAALLTASIALTGALLTGCSISDPAVTVVDTDWVLSEVRANTYTYNRQTQPTVAPTDDGGMVVAWASRRQEDGAFGVYAQRLDAIGRPMGPEMHINQHGYGAQDQPAIAVAETGDVWIAWSSTHIDGDARAIMARRYAQTDSGIEPSADETMINLTHEGDQASPSIAIAGDSILISWTSAAGNSSSVVARCFSIDGSDMSEEIEISSKATTDRTASVASAQDGFVAAWASHDPISDSRFVTMQRLDMQGQPVGDSKRLQSESGRHRIEPSIAADHSAITTVAWLEHNDSHSYRVMAQRFDAAFEPVSEILSISEAHGASASGAVVTAAPDGRFAILWNAEGEKIDNPIAGKRPTQLADILVQRFDADASVIGEPMIVNQTTVLRQAMTIGGTSPRAVWTGQDQLIAVWHGTTIDDKRGVGVSIANPSALASSTRSTPTPWTKEATDSDVAMAPPVFDPTFVPQPRDATARGIGNDFGFLAIPATGWNPPDPDLAVGPNHIVAVVNGGIAWFNKSGGLQFQQNIAGGGGFWGPQGAQGFVFDPIALYDVHSERFVVAATERDGAGFDYNVLAISNTNDPNDGWQKFRHNVSAFGDEIDFPNIGVDADAVYISVDFFGSPSGSKVFAYDKADLIAGIIDVEVYTLAAFPTVTAGVYSYDANPNYYTLTSFNSGPGQLRLMAIVDPLVSGSINTFFLNVPTYSSPPGAPQLGTSNLASTVDFRIKHAVYRNGSLWCAHAVNAGGAATVRWYEIEMNGWPQSALTPTLKQTGDITPAPGIHTWFPAISVDDDGNAAIAYNRSSFNEFIKISRAVRKAGDPLGEFRPSIINQESSSPENGDRWGDYAGIHEDPADPGTFWSLLEYRTSFWNSWAARFSAANANPGRFDLVSPSNGALAATTTPQFTWTGAADADNYTITLATDAALTNIVHQELVVGTQFTPTPGTLDCAVEYHWGVVAGNVGGDSGSSPLTRRVTVSITGDINADGIVDTADLGGLIGAFGGSGPFADINLDGVVDTADLGQLIGAFGKSCQ